MPERCECILGEQWQQIVAELHGHLCVFACACGPSCLGLIGGVQVITGDVQRGKIMKQRVLYTQ